MPHAPTKIMDRPLSCYMPQIIIEVQCDPMNFNFLTNYINTTLTLQCYV